MNSLLHRFLEWHQRHHWHCVSCVSLWYHPFEQNFAIQLSTNIQNFRKLPPTSYFTPQLWKKVEKFSATRGCTSKQLGWCLDFVYSIWLKKKDWTEVESGWKNDGNRCCELKLDKKESVEGFERLVSWFSNRWNLWLVKLIAGLKQDMRRKEIKRNYPSWN